MISSSENRVSYNGNGTATEFAYQFKILEKSDIKVMRVDADGNTEILTKDYYVDAEKNVVIYPGYAPGAEIPESERPPVLPSGWRLVLYREVPITQLSRLPEIWPFNVIEAMADKLTIICQQLKDAISRCLKINESSDKNIDTTIPWEAGKTFRVSDDGTHLESTEDPGKVYEASKGFAEAAATSATNAIAANKEAQQANEEVKQIYNNGSLTPISDLAGSIGTELKRWGTIFANKVFASNLPLMYNSVSDMKSDKKLKAGMTACTLGYYSPNDGGAGTYIIRAKQDGDVDDGGSLHEISSKLVAELVVENGTVCPEQFGAKGDGVSDDTEAIQKAVNKNKKVSFFAKTYCCNNITISKHGIILEGQKSSNTNNGTILKPFDINSAYVLRVGYFESYTTGQPMRIGGYIRNIAIQGNGTRQDINNRYKGYGVEIKNLAEFNIENVFISGCEKGGLYAEDYWDSTILSLEIRACGISGTNAALTLASNTDSSNSLHFFGMHIEMCPYQLKLDGLTSHIHFVACKFESGVSLENTTDNYIYIYEGCYGITFSSCYFSYPLSLACVAILISNLYSIFNACHFSSCAGTLLKIASNNNSFGKTIIVTNCIFEDEKDINDGALVYMNSYCVFTNNIIYLHEGHLEFNANNIIKNNIISAPNSGTPRVILFGTENKCKNTFKNCTNNVYQYTSAKNSIDTHSNVFTTVTSTDFTINFANAAYYNIIYNAKDETTITAKNFLNFSQDIYFVFYSNTKNVTVSQDIYPPGLIMTPGVYYTFKYNNLFNTIYRVM